MINFLAGKLMDMICNAWDGYRGRQGMDLLWWYRK